MNYVTGKVIKELREKNGLTQKELANQLQVSDKTISKWENERGLPDIGILTDLAKVLKVSVAELLAGNYITNENKAANMNKAIFYVCPICGNVICSLGQGAFSCCGIQLISLDCEEDTLEHEMKIETNENEYYISMKHEMTKQHYISFVAYVTCDSMQLVKLYPEQGCQARFLRKGHGTIYSYCNRHGLMKYKV